MVRIQPSPPFLSDRDLIMKFPRYMNRYTDSQKALFKKPLFGFYAEPGAGAEGSVTIVIKKSPLLWLYRLVRFWEPSRHVLDTKKRVIVFNKAKRLEWFMTRQVQFGASIDYYGRNMGKDEYEKHWASEGYTPEMLKADRSIDPSYPKPYHRHFFLEHPTSSRMIIPFWQPTRVIKERP